MTTASLTELDNDLVQSMSIGVAFLLVKGKRKFCWMIHSIDLHQKDVLFLSLFMRNTVLIVYVVLIIQALLYALQRRVFSLCMSPINDSFMSGSLDHNVRIWDLWVNACHVGCFHFFLFY
uniref:Uncharacterized protein n=1 Tax=Glycine max TaxID=3847 RepID=K7KJ07_SOYBN